MEDFKPGDRVRCVNARCDDMVKAGALTEGKVYTVGHVPGDGWSLYLRQLPALQFNARRFERVMPS